MKNEIVSREEWTRRRKVLLEKEKEFTRLRDELSARRRALPWVVISKDYKFRDANGTHRLADLFGQHSQLVIYHFMFGPDDEKGCKICSFWADNFNPVAQHLARRDVALAAVSRAPFDKIDAFRKQRGWSFRWFSSHGSDFNPDFQVTLEAGKPNSYNYRTITPEKSEEMPGISVFYKDDNGKVYHTYSCYARELETFNTAYRYLDIVPKGRDEDDLPWPMAWVEFVTRD